MGARAGWRSSESSKLSGGSMPASWRWARNRPTDALHVVEREGRDGDTAGDRVHTWRSSR
ncbi:hypothetical protein BE08_40335 [Sorangium cellulosum]|uniref:Uncharacterized protein n=1 Tax=Sorangium cellulosum TaxID=56 RepID=A0A150PSN2_SORCE|nr:hypothetical protein BE08_40335 [Sorangium cellulosum]